MDDFLKPDRIVVGIDSDKAKKEMERLTKIGVFSKDHNSEWAAPTFIQPKKTGDVRILTDFRRLNAVMKRMVLFGAPPQWTVSQLLHPI